MRECLGAPCDKALEEREIAESFVLDALGNEATGVALDTAFLTKLRNKRLSPSADVRTGMG
jgi:hypothetical protein